MATRKPDSLVGPLGVWAYNTRILLELSDEQAARAAHVSKATIRKVEGGSTRHPSARLLHELYKFYRAEGERLDRPVEEPPGYRSPVVEPPPDPIVAAIDRLTAAVEAQTRQQADGLEALASVLGVVLHRLGGLTVQTPDERASQ